MTESDTTGSGKDDLSNKSRTYEGTEEGAQSGANDTNTLLLKVVEILADRDTCVSQNRSTQGQQAQLSKGGLNQTSDGRNAGNASENHNIRDEQDGGSRELHELL